MVTRTQVEQKITLLQNEQVAIIKRLGTINEAAEYNKLLDEVDSSQEEVNSLRFVLRNEHKATCIFCRKEEETEYKVISYICSDCNSIK